MTDRDPLEIALGELKLMRLEPQLRDMGAATVDDLLHLDDEDLKELNLKKLERKRYIRWRADWKQDHHTTNMTTATSTAAAAAAVQSQHSKRTMAAGESKQTHSSKSNGTTTSTSTSIESLVGEMVALLAGEVQDSYGLMRRKFVDIAASFGIQRPIAFATCEEMGFEDDFLAYPDRLWWVNGDASTLKELYQNTLLKMFSTLDNDLKKHVGAVKHRRKSMTMMLSQLKLGKR
jgi:hypothetical protein